MKTIVYELQLQLVSGENRMVVSAGSVLYCKQEGQESAPELILISLEDETAVSPVFGVASASRLVSAPAEPARVVLSTRWPGIKSGSNVFKGIEMPSRILVSFND